MAERVGFEPTDRISDHLISSQARSASSGTSPDGMLFKTCRPHDFGRDDSFSLLYNRAANSTQTGLDLITLF